MVVLRLVVDGRSNAEMMVAVTVLVLSLLVVVVVMPRGGCRCC